MQTGQNSITPENALPQIEQVRLSFVFMGLTPFSCDQSLAKDMNLLVNLCGSATVPPTSSRNFSFKCKFGGRPIWLARPDRGQGG
jgi:hypothetical protein